MIGWIFAAEPGAMTFLPWVVMGIACLFGLIFLILFANLLRLWNQAWFAGVHVTMMELIGMRLRKVDAREIVQARITAVRAGLDIPLEAMENHYLAGGRVFDAVKAIIAAGHANIELDWEMATAIDLSGRNVLDFVETSITSKVLDRLAPAADKTTSDGMGEEIL